MIHGLPDKLRKLRSTFGLSQRDVARQLKLSPSIISSYETGERTPSTEVLIALATLYQCSIDYLLGMDNKPPKTMIDLDGLSEKQIQIIVDLTKDFRQRSFKKNNFS